MTSPPISGGTDLPQETAPSIVEYTSKLLLAFAQSRSFIGTDTPHGPKTRPGKTKLQAKYLGYFWGPF